MYHLLVIEDEPELREHIQRIFKLEGYTVYSSANGIEGIQLALEVIPDLIICDIIMPEIDGYAVLENLRDSSATAHIPFIFLTAKSTHDDLRRGMSLGADDYITKPFAVEDLVAAVKTRLEKYHQQENHRLRKFSRKMMELQEEDRGRIAQQLQDEIAQQLANLKMILDIGTQLSADPESIFEKLEVNLDSILQKANDLTWSLWPTMLEHLGLLPALDWQLQELQRKHNIALAFQQVGLSRNFGQQVELIVYRTLEQLIEYAATFPRIDHITIYGWVEGNTLIIEIEIKNGSQMLHQALDDDFSPLMMIEERIAALSGSISLTSTPENDLWVIVNAEVPEESTLTNYNRIKASNGMPSLKNDFSPENNTIKLITVSESDIVKQGLRHIFELEEDFTLIAEANSLDDLERLGTLPPCDVIILDLNRLGINYPPFIQKTQRMFPHIRILVLSIYPEIAFAHEMLQLGVSAYILKGTSSSELVEAIQTINAGQQYISPSIQEDGPKVSSALSERLNAFSLLTSREHEIMQWVIQGKTSLEIGAMLVISPRTVEKHRANLMQKLGVRNHRELVQYAIKHGMTSTE